MVFIPGMENNILPHSRAQENAGGDGGGAPPGLRRDHARQAVLYLIHAFRRCLWGRVTVSEPSRFLRELPSEALQQSKERSKRPAGERRSSDEWDTEREARPTRRPSATPSTPRPARETPSSEATLWNTRRAGSARETSGKAASFRAGDRVRHAKFGEGIVVSCQPSGGDEEVVVAFPGNGTKKLLASFAPLEKL